MISGHSESSFIDASVGGSLLGVNQCYNAKSPLILCGLESRHAGGYPFALAEFFHCAILPRDNISFRDGTWPASILEPLTQSPSIAEAAQKNKINIVRVANRIGLETWKASCGIEFVLGAVQNFSAVETRIYSTGSDRRNVRYVQWASRSNDSWDGETHFTAIPKVTGHRISKT
ncbi:hypothetical protein K439DRAFT_233311 [Ramaria rubella]|nr:hypothetical protein K439DRAFT_233311 [Ramaria rubella]